MDGGDIVADPPIFGRNAGGPPRANAGDGGAPPKATATDGAPEIRRLTAPNPGPMTADGTNTFLIGEAAVAIVDPGPEHAGHRRAILAAVAPDARIEAIIVTHRHRDHCDGAATLAAETGAPVFAFDPAEAGPGPLERLGLDRRDAAFGGGEGVNLDFRADRRLRHDETLSASDGSWRITGVYTPGHIDDHLCLAVTTGARSTLLTGDVVMAWSTSLVSPPDGDVSAYMRSLDALLDRGDALHLPAHGPQIVDPPARLKALRDHRLARERQILTALADGPGDAATMARRIYTDAPEQMLPMAARNVLAHLLDLWERGQITPLDPPSAVARFRLSAHA